MAVGDKQYFLKEITSTNKLHADLLNTTDSTLWASKQDTLTSETDVEVKDLQAKSLNIDDGCTMQYDATNKCINFIFN